MRDQIVTGSGIIETRYRDIPWEEIADKFEPAERAYFAMVWPKRRGVRISIQTPPFVPTDHVLICKGPFYRVVDASGKQLKSERNKSLSVCTCVAEIGD